MRNYHDNYFHYWQWFVSNHQDELYDVIMSMMKDRIEELLPPIIDRYLCENFSNFTVDIKTTINGRETTELKDVITDMILKELRG